MLVINVININLTTTLVCKLDKYYVNFCIIVYILMISVISVTMHLLFLIKILYIYIYIYMQLKENIKILKKLFLLYFDINRIPVILFEIACFLFVSLIADSDRSRWKKER
jgi:hypothetical protein